MSLFTRYEGMNLDWAVQPVDGLRTIPLLGATRSARLRTPQTEVAAQYSPSGPLSRPMPPLTDLAQRVAADPDWAEGYRNAFPGGQRLARAVPLVHVTGVRHGVAPDRCVAFERLLFDEPHEIPTSDHPVYCSDATRNAEDLLGLGRSAYFYAGRACPDFGDVALAYSAECEIGHTGSVTPFDTGGLILGYIQGNMPPDLADRALFGRVSVILLDGWRDPFAMYIAAYFPDRVGYWTGRPARLDPEDIYQHHGNSYRAWTFEVRFSEGHSIYRHLSGWCARETFMTELRRLLDLTPLTGPDGVPSPLERFLLSGRLIIPTGDPDFCGRMEQWIRAELDL